MIEPKHLKYDLMDANCVGPPKAIMELFGITYQHATPQSMSDQWWFWNCENIPDVLPKYLSVLENDPMECIGYGLSEQDAIKIRDYKKPKGDQR